jgi:hypothetical protein
MKSRPFIIITAMIVLIPSCIFAQFAIPREVLGSGIVQSGNANNKIIGTIGQIIIGQTNTSTQKGSFGFWYDKATIPTAVERVADPTPSTILLEQNYPNPAAATTTIRFSLPVSQHVHLFIVDALGRMVSNVAEGSFEAGSYQTDIRVSDLPAGAYFYSLHSGKKILSRSMTVVK